MQYKSLQSHQWFLLARSLPHEGRWRSLALRFFVTQGFPERWDTSESVWTKFLPLSYSKSNLIRSQKFRFPKQKINSSDKLLQKNHVGEGKLNHNWYCSSGNPSNDSGRFVSLGKVVRNSTNGLHTAKNEPSQTTDEIVGICKEYQA